MLACGGYRKTGNILRGMIISFRPICIFSKYLLTIHHMSDADTCARDKL